MMKTLSLAEADYLRMRHLAPRERKGMESALLEQLWSVKGCVQMNPEDLRNLLRTEGKEEVD